MSENPKQNKAYVLWLTGLSGSGKSTLAEKIYQRLSVAGVAVEHLDGDKVREVFPQTGFDRKARNEHIMRIGFLAGKLEKHGVVVVASFISPFQESREFARRQCCNFIEIYLNTPIDVCRQRDPKGLYQKVAEGKITNFTGVHESYEAPVSPELILDTSRLSVDECVGEIMACIQRKENYGT